MTGFSQPERRGLQRMQLNPGAPSSPSFDDGKTATHPDADLLTAFAERSLTAREKEQVLGHLAVCATCRDVVALAGSALVEPVPEPVRKRAIWEMPLFHWGAVAATTIVVVAAVSLGMHERRAPSTTAAIQSELPPAAVAEKDDKVAAAPAAPIENRAKQAIAAKGVPAESAPTPPVASPETTKHALHLQQEARFERPSGAVAKKEINVPAANGVVGGAVANSPSPATPPAQDAARDSVDHGTANSMMKTRAADIAQAPAAAPPAASSAQREAGAYNVRTNESLTVDMRTGAVTQTEQAAPNAAPQGAATRHKREPYSAKSIDQGAAPALAFARQWQLSKNGQLQHSSAQGAWNDVLPGQKFNRLAIVQDHVWAGGDNGVLYFSADNGQTWTTLPVRSGATVLTGNITALQFTDTQNGSLQTSTGETWRTQDGGQNWTRQ